MGLARKRVETKNLNDRELSFGGGDGLRGKRATLVKEGARETLPLGRISHQEKSETPPPPGQEEGKPSRE